MRLYSATLYMFDPNKKYQVNKNTIKANDNNLFRAVQTMIVRKKLDGTVSEIVSGITFPIMKQFSDKNTYHISQKDRLLYVLIGEKLSKKESVKIKENYFSEKIIDQTIENLNELVLYENEKINENKVKTKIKSL